MEKIPLFRRWDVIPVIACAALAVGLCVWSVSREGGKRLVVETPAGETVYALAEDRQVEIDGDHGLHLTVCIEDGSAFVKEANCPDQVCVHTGRLTRDGQSAVCVPAGVILTLRGGDGTTDAVAR